MKKFKAVTIVGTRPEIIRLSSVIKELDANPAVEHLLIHTGQNYDYELNQVFFDDLGLKKPDYFLEAAGKNAIATIGNVLINVSELLEEIKPDSVLVLGDTNSCYAALAAKLMKIPVFHMEAGNRCFDLRVPEEINRRVVDHISDINLCYSDIAREYLTRENIPPERVIRTGSPMYEVLHSNMDKINSSDILNRLSLAKGKYFLISSHRAENVDSEKGINNFLTMLENLNKEYGMKVIVSTHPRTRKSIEKTGRKLSDEVHFLPPFGFFDYVNLQINAFVTLSDSGTISEESSILNFPALNLREAHERPEAMEEASVMMVGYSWERIKQGVETLKHDQNLEKRDFMIVKDYSYPNISKKVVRIMISYKNFVDQKVWYKFDS